MKILVVSQHYWPENFRITDVAESLVTLGHDITVLCGLPNYPGGYVLPEYKRKQNRIQIHNGVKIIRAKEIGRRHNVLFRFLNYWSYPHYASKLIRHLDKDFDVVYVQMTSPIMMTKPGIAYAKRYGKKLVMYEMDLWPESLLAGGVSKGSVIYKHYKRISADIYSRCDKILVSTKEHANYIHALPKCGQLDIDYLPQYADTLFEESNYETIHNGVIDLMFAGNIGKAQSMGTIIKAAHLLKNDPRFKFHIVGDGSELSNSKSLASQLKLENIVFYGQMDLKEMPRMYQLADVMLVTLENKAYANMTIPGKVQSYMAAGKPIIGAVSGSCNSFIKNNQIGYACEAEDYEGLARLLLEINETELQEAGTRARAVYYRKYSKQNFLNALHRCFESVL